MVGIRRQRARTTAATFAPLCLAALLMLTAGCSVRGMALRSLADGLSATGDGFASEADPELVRDAAPFGLKLMESLLAEQPTHPGLLLALTRGFTQYAYAFVETEAVLLEDVDPERSAEQHRRALGLYLRARNYGLRALELRSPGSRAGWKQSPDDAALAFGPSDVPLLYWTAAAWGAAISSGREDPALLADFPAVRALLSRALLLEPDYESGALHEAMISLESLSPLLGGSPERATAHFERALELSEGAKAGPYVTLASGLAVARQDRAGFETLLAAALAVDPDEVPSLRLPNLIAQRRARYLLSRIDHLFFDEPEARERGIP